MPRNHDSDSAARKCPARGVLVVKSPKGSTLQPFEATVTPRDELGFARTDANPADNTVTKSFDERCQAGRQRLPGSGGSAQ
ncbi:MAG: hypothetical protein U0787_03265 [Polyangia bacterium]